MWKKKILVSLILCLICFNCFAVTAELKSVTRDDNRNLFWIVIEYTMADSEVIENAYPVATFDLMGKTQAQIFEFLTTNVKHQCDNYIAREFFERNTILENILKGFVGGVVTKNEALVEIDNDNDGVVNKTFEIKEDGTYEEVTP